MKTFTVEVTQVVQAYALQPVAEDATFEELRLTDVERDAIALDLENVLGVRVCDTVARGWQSVGDVLRSVARSADAVREAMA